MKAYQLILMLITGIGVIMTFSSSLLIKQIDYKIENGKVIYRTFNNVSLRWDFREVKGADAKSFKKLGHGYGMDKSYVYVKARILEQADPKSFRIIDGPIGWCQDANTVYRYGNKVSDEPQHFKRLDEYYFKDRQQVFYTTHVLENVDPNTFEVIGENGFYAKDHKQVFCSGKIIAKADATSFQHLEGLFAADASRVYYAGKALELSTMEGLQLLDEDYGKTTQQVFYHNKLIKGADAETFHLGKSKLEFTIGIDKYGEYEYGRRKP